MHVWLSKGHPILSVQHTVHKGHKQPVVCHVGRALTLTTQLAHNILSTIATLNIDNVKPFAVIALQCETFPVVLKVKLRDLDWFMASWTYFTNIFKIPKTMQSSCRNLTFKATVTWTTEKLHRLVVFKHYNLVHNIPNLKPWSLPGPCSHGSVTFWTVSCFKNHPVFILLVKSYTIQMNIYKFCILMMSIDWNNNETVMSYMIVWLKFLYVYYYDYAHYYMIHAINYMWIICLHCNANLFFL